MVRYHPDTRFLTEFAAGSLPRSQALCVAAHLHYCPSCRNRVQELTQVGAALFLNQAPIPVQADAFQQLMKRIDHPQDHTARPAAPASDAADLQWQAPAVPILPLGLHKLAQGDTRKLKWRALGKRFRYSQVNAGDAARSTALLHIKAGGRLPWHRHTGNEITVVLKGSFSDQEDHYHLGDFVVRTTGDKHRPVASQHEDCLCLATLDSPITVTNWLQRLIHPLSYLRSA